MDELRDLIAFIAKSLVDDPDSVSVRAMEGDRTIMLELSVARSDLGKVIGKEGRTARAMRTVLAATSARLQKRAMLEILG